LRVELDPMAWGRALWQNPLLFLTAMLIGAIATFVYSYGPLHRSKDWEIRYLETRLQSRNAYARELEGSLEGADAGPVELPSDDALQVLRAGLERSNERALSLERDAEGALEKLKGKLAGMTRKRDSWRSKHAQAEKDYERLETERADIQPSPTPAAPAYEREKSQGPAAELEDDFAPGASPAVAESAASPDSLHDLPSSLGDSQPAAPAGSSPASANGPSPLE